jgi:hypothetical protein
MDVEGAEIDLLPAMLDILPRQTVFFLETHYADATCEKLLAPYRSAAFAVSEVRRRAAEGREFSYIEWILSRSS